MNFYKNQEKREKQQKTAENEVFKTISWAIIANNSSKCINLQQNTRKLANSRIYTKSTKMRHFRAISGPTMPYFQHY